MLKEHIGRAVINGRGSRGRGLWFFVHWITGTAVSLLGIVNIYTGLQAYHQKTSRRIHLWTVLFTAEVSFIIFFYLFQDKWDYMQKQGVILEPLRPTHRIISPGEKQKGSATESC
uniref:Cytochrome b561 domain-containing protein n=1 Tax=Salix viminalis TaxID=40686 RepID=A0A6N2KLU0_SALVM